MRLYKFFNSSQIYGGDFMFTHELDSYPNRINKLNNMIYKHTSRYEKKPTVQLEHKIEAMLKEKYELETEFKKINANRHELFVNLMKYLFDVKCKRKDNYYEFWDYFRI